jgi:hypothetical protein
MRSLKDFKKIFQQKKKSKRKTKEEMKDFKKIFQQKRETKSETKEK